MSGPASGTRGNQLASHGLPAEDVIAAVESHGIEGLSPDEARRRIQRFGPNALAEPKRRSLLLVFLGQFKSPLIHLLIVAAGIALALGHISDALVIFTVVVLNAFIGAFHEGRAPARLSRETSFCSRLEMP